MKKNKQTQKEREYFHAFYKGNKLLWVLVMGLTFIGAPLNLGVSWLLKEAMDVITTGDMDWLMELVRIAVVYFAVLTGLDLLRYRLKAVYVHRALEQYKSTAFRNLSQKSISAFSRENTGRYISVLTNDIGSIEESYLNQSFSIVYQLLMAVSSAAMMYWYSPKLGLVCMLLSAVPVVLAVLMGGELEKRTKAVSDQNEFFVAQVKDLLSGFSVLKSFKAEPEAGRLFDSSNAKTEKIKLHRRWWDCVLTAMQQTCSMLLQMGVVFVGGYMAIKGEITPGVAIIMVNLCGTMINPINYVPQAWAARKSAKALIAKLARVTEENTGHSGQRIAPALSDRIALENLSFGYEEGKPVLKDVSLCIETGKKYAIVGASGSGKSTLLNLLMGSYDGYSGSIAIDGKELRSIDPDSLYDIMSLIGQNVFLFDSTIRENITMFREFPREAVDSAAERSGLAPVMAAKGEGYRCGENGVGLSGGERQRVSIARALLRNTPVLMLDEATAALDNQTAFEVTEAILKLDGTTRIVVTHRLEEQLLRQYDRIIVLREGRVTEQGTYAELMDKAGYFYSLYNVSN